MEVSALPFFSYEYPPTEIGLKIFSYFQFNQMGKFRLVCRNWNTLITENTPFNFFKYTHIIGEKKSHCAEKGLSSFEMAGNFAAYTYQFSAYTKENEKAITACNLFFFNYRTAQEKELQIYEPQKQTWPEISNHFRSYIHLQTDGILMVRELYALPNKWDLNQDPVNICGERSEANNMMTYSSKNSSGDFAYAIQSSKEIFIQRELGSIQSVSILEEYPSGDFVGLILLNKSLVAIFNEHQSYFPKNQPRSFIFLFDLESTEPKSQEFSVSVLQLAADEHRIVVATKDDLFSFDCSTLEAISQFSFNSFSEKAPENVYNFCIHGNHLIASDGIGMIGIWDANTLELKNKIPQAAAKNQIFCYEGKLILASQTKKCLEIWNLKTLEIVFTIPTNDYPTSIKISLNEKGEEIWVAGLKNGQLQIWTSDFQS